MEWIAAQDLQTWANRIEARQILPSLVGQLIRASSPNISAFRFPSGDAAQIHGWDGLLTAEPLGQYAAYVPAEDSVWEFGVAKSPKSKAEDDYVKRAASPASVVPSSTTFVFVTPRIWEDGADWAKSKREQGIWKDVRVIDAVDLEAWMSLCPSVAAAFARDNNFIPAVGALCIDEFWDVYSRRFEPPLTESVLLAGRIDQCKEVQTSLATGFGNKRVKGDSLDEVVAFICAAVRTADPGTQSFLKARVLIVETNNAARQLGPIPNLSFVVRGEAKEASGMLSEKHRVIVPVGRDNLQSSSVLSLIRPTAYEMSEALQTMGFMPERAVTLAHECGKSVTVLTRRIASGDPSACDWRGDASLLAAFLAGAWDQSSSADKAIISALAGADLYEDAEAAFRSYLKHPDGPLERIDNVWAVRAPVDMFVQFSHLLGESHWNQLRKAVNTVLCERDPAFDLPPGERMYAGLNRRTLTHSAWLRDGLCTTLLILAALGEQNELQIGERTPQMFVNELIASLPGLNEDYRVLESLSHQLPMLMEAAPEPLLSALKRLLGGGGEGLTPFFQDGHNTSSLWTHSPHTGLLWALELIGRDPLYLQRTASILVGLEAVDPGGTLSNRPIMSLRHLFSTWRPGTNASHETRLAVLSHLLTLDASVAWKLILALMPDRREFQMEGPQPRFREAGASDREVLTYPILYKTVTWITSQAIKLAAYDPLRWTALLDKIHQLPYGDRESLIAALHAATTNMNEGERAALWRPLWKLIRRHRSHISAEWALRGNEIASLELIEQAISPQDTTVKEQYLFTERLPDILGLAESRVWEKIEEMRHEVIRRLLATGDISTVVKFASEVEAPRYVGSSLGVVAGSPGELLNAIKVYDRLAISLDGFVSTISVAGLTRFHRAWSSGVEAAISHGDIDKGRILDLAQLWPHTAKTWRWVQQFGPIAEQTFWQQRSAWGLDAVGEELGYAINTYLAFERPEYLIDAFAYRAEQVSAEQWFDIFTAFESRVPSHPELISSHRVGYELQQIFKSLQVRPGISIERLAVFEFKFLPLLRQLLSDYDPDSALDKYLAQNPVPFVDLITAVFRPARERDEPKPETTPEESARAQNSFRALESFGRVPGADGNRIDPSFLERWVAEVRLLSETADRLTIAEQQIGKVLCRCEDDPDDGIWPHRVIREGLERWQATQIEKGIYIAKLNSRGVTSRGAYDGGSQERNLAQEFRHNAQKVRAWPRTHALLIQLAESYERQAQTEDAQAALLRLRE